MIKNWTVTTQPVKNGSDGLIVRERYLTSRKHPNHRKTENIISIVGSLNTTARIALIGEQFKLKQKLAKKGGRPLASMAMEFCLTLPRGMRPTVTQWRLIVRDCVKSLAEKLDLDRDETELFFQQVRAVLHQQPQTGGRGSSSGDHTHILLGKTVNNRTLKDLQRRDAIAVVKQAFNHAVLVHYGANYQDYKPVELNQGKRLESWRYTLNKLDESVELQKVLKRMQNQSDKWFKAFRGGDSNQCNRQFNRLNKTFLAFKELDSSNELKEDVEYLKNEIQVAAGKSFN